MIIMIPNRMSVIFVSVVSVAFAVAFVVLAIAVDDVFAIAVTCIDMKFLASH